MATIREVPQIEFQNEAANPLNSWLNTRFQLNWETGVYFVILLLAIFTRFYMLGARTMSHDESLHTKFSWDLYSSGNFQHTPLMHGPILFHMTALDYFLFGDNDFTARIYPAVLGVLMVMFPLLFRRWLGRWGAILASVMVLISPLLLYYNRYIREDTPSIFFTLVMVYCTMMYLNGPIEVRRKARWLYIFSAAMLGSLATKEVAFIYIAIFGSFLTLYWLVRVGQHFFRLPGKSLFYFLSIAGLVGGIAAIGLYIVLAIVPLGTATTLGAGSVEFANLIKWTAAAVVVILLIVVGTLLWSFRQSAARIPWLDVVLLLALVVVAATAMIVVEERSHVTTQEATEAASPAVPGQPGAETVLAGYSALPFYGFWVFGIIVIGGILYLHWAGWWHKLRRFPELDILIVMGTLVLPWLTPLVMKAMNADPTSMNSIAAAVQAALPIQFDLSQYGIQIFLSVLPVVPAIGIAVVLGLIWDRKRWLICAVIFHVLFLFFFTTVFTNIQGVGTGMIGSLGYWLKQQGVRRGSQPQYYYYLVIMPFYEFLPLIGSVLAMLAGMKYFWGFRRERLEEQLPLPEIGMADEEASVTASEQVPDETTPRRRTVLPVERLREVPFLLYVSWWAVFNLIALTLAGEKMPWLATHLTTPMIFLAGWYFGGFIERIDATAFWKRNWLYLLLLLVLLVAGAQIAAPFIFSAGPSGLEQIQLTRTFQWFGGILIAGIVIYAIFRLVEQGGWAQFRLMVSLAVFAGLAFLTFRSAWMASFIHYDEASEFLVYAHGGPANKWVSEELEDLSRRITGGMDLKFAYDFKISWPGAWYFRNFKGAVYMGETPSPRVMDDALVVIVGDENRAAVQGMLEDRYYQRSYIRMWWPMQEYFGLTPQRVDSLLDFSPDNKLAQEFRQGIWDMWWTRDYTTYANGLRDQARQQGRDEAYIQENLWDGGLTKWPVADRMYVFVRKDIAAEVWNLGVGEGTAVAAGTVQVNQCNANWQPREANQVLNVSVAGTLPMNHPRQIAIAPDGRIYAAEEFTHRISVFNADGTFAFAFGSEGSGTGQFERPNAVAIGTDGKVYVADTWNYRVQVFTPDGEYIGGWGQRGEFGSNAQMQPVDALWGPRAIAVDNQNRVYVSDTGNKRIRVYTSDGQYLRDIGSGGSGVGQLDEPSGLAISSDNLLYVADTWNRRVSVFTLDGLPANNYLTSEGQPTNSFKVRGWIDDLGNRPYLALDTQRNLLYVTDPDAGRVMVFDTNGSCVGSFGQLGHENLDLTQFSSIGGVLSDSQGNVYVADSGAGRILRFPPFERPVPQPQSDQSGQAAPAEVTSEVVSPLDGEATPEVTAAG